MDDEQEVVDAVLKFVVLALVIGAVVGLVTLVAVKTLGVTGGDDGGGSTEPLATATPSALPTVALSGSPNASSSSGAGDGPGDDASSDGPGRSSRPADGTLTLSASPGQVAPGEQINLAGTYQGRDGLDLQVQRKDAGQWGPFATVTVPVRAGSFATYVITSHTGPQVFRVFDTSADKGSNPVTVTVG